MKIINRAPRRRLFPFSSYYVHRTDDATMISEDVTRAAQPNVMWDAASFGRLTPLARSPALLSLRSPLTRPALSPLASTDLI